MVEHQSKINAIQFSHSLLKGLGLMLPRLQKRVNSKIITCTTFPIQQTDLLSTHQYGVPINDFLLAKVSDIRAAIPKSAVDNTKFIYFQLIHVLVLQIKNNKYMHTNGKNFF